MNGCHTPASPETRLRSSAASFLREERGAATLWNVTWLLVFVGFAGLSLDSANGYRNIAISQSTADTASLAGAAELPNPLLEIPYDTADGAYDGTVKAAALSYAERNMDPGIYGNVLTENEILIGNWNADTRTFTWGEGFEAPDALPVNAVRVYQFQNEAARKNGVGMLLMPWVGLDTLSVSTTSTSVYGPTDCQLQGFMAKARVCSTSHNEYYPGFCIYGNEGVRMNSSVFHRNANGDVAIQASMPMDDDGEVPNSNDGIPDEYKSTNGGDLNVTYEEMIIPFIDTAPGIPEVTLFILDRDMEKAPYHTTPRFGSNVNLALPVVWFDPGGGTNQPATIASNMDPEYELQDEAIPAGNPPKNVPSGSAPGSKSCTGGPSPGSELADLGGFDQFRTAAMQNGADPENPETDSVLDRNRIYYTTRDIEIDGDLRDVVIVTEGRISITSTSTLEDVTLVSLDQSNGKHQVDLNKARLGNVDACKEGGEVKVYSMGSINGSQNDFYGTTLVAGGTVGFSAKNNGALGVAVYSAGNIFTAAHNDLSPPELADIKAHGCSDATAVNVPEENFRISIVD